MSQIKITAELKDRVLFSIKNSVALERMLVIITREMESDADCPYDALRAILYQFERMGFISSLGVGNENTMFIAHAELHDYAERGGFAVQEELFRANIEKLGFEIDMLRKELPVDYLEKLNKISGIASAIMTGLDRISNI
jgi:hypothetical protein